MAAKRIYVVTTADGERLVEASSKSQAVTYVANSTITAEVASQSDLVRLVGDGVSVEGTGDPAEAA
jgi:hypothetical protein